MKHIWLQAIFNSSQPGDWQTWQGVFLYTCKHFLCFSLIPADGLSNKRHQLLTWHSLVLLSCFWHTVAWVYSQVYYGTLFSTATASSRSWCWQGMYNIKSHVSTCFEECYENFKIANPQTLWVGNVYATMLTWQVAKWALTLVCVRKNVTDAN